MYESGNNPDSLNIARSTCFACFMACMLLVPAFLTSCRNHSEGTGPGKRPNIVLIMADDMGYSDLGAFGSEIHTPNLDELAAGGLILTNFYNTSRCCPSRAALMTGIYQHEAGVGNMTGDMGDPAYQGYLNEQCVTIAEVLKEAGYRTMMSGKWHLGSDPAYWPQKRGFDRFFGIPQGGGVYFFPIRSGRDIILDGKQAVVDSTTFYTTDAFNDQAATFIREHVAASADDKPFFLYLPHIAPHFPLQAKEEDIAKYRGTYKKGFDHYRKKRIQRMKSLEILQVSSDISAPDSEVLDWEDLTEAEKDSMDLKMATYAAQVDCLDQGIGRIVQTLKDLGIFEDTVIFFLSDNGGTHENVSSKEISGGPIGSRNSFSSYGRSWANVSNAPFRMYKHWVHEGGIASPLLVSYPRLIKETRIETELAHIMDIMPTCLDLAGASYPDVYQGKPIKPLRGKSLYPLVKGTQRKGHDWLFWEHQGNRAVRNGKWKLVAKGGESNWELYDLETDRIESQDLSSSYPQRVEDMESAYQSWAQEVGVKPWEFFRNR